MKLFYTDEGFILQALYDVEVFARKRDRPTININALVIDEVSGNLDLCRDVYITVGKTNSAGEEKYYISGGELHSRDGWKAA